MRELKFTISPTFPARTGLGTSSAFTVGLLLALYALQDKMRDKHALATDAIHVEQDVIGEAVGSQDQVSAAYGGFNRINFNLDGSIEVRPVLTAPSRFDELEQCLMLVFTGFSRIASEIATDQVRLTPYREHELQQISELVAQGEALLTNPQGSIDEFGRLLHEGWRIKKTLTGKITNSDIDDIYAAALEGGALGGKLLGAGGGGFMLLFVPPEKRKELRRKLNKLLCVPFSFSKRGSHVEVYEPDQPYDKSLVNERQAVYS